MGIATLDLLNAEIVALSVFIQSQSASSIRVGAHQALNSKRMNLSPFKRNPNKKKLTLLNILVFLLLTSENFGLPFYFSIVIVCLVEYSLEQDEPWVQGTIIPNINQFPILNINEASKELEIPFHKVSLRYQSIR